MGNIIKFRNIRKQKDAVHMFSLATAIVAGLFGGNYLFDHQYQIKQLTQKSFRATSATFKKASTAILSCNIKGNISQNTGERIYHVPGQKYYFQTRISPRYGERWFCSEADARAAGWRKSRI